MKNSSSLTNSATIPQKLIDEVCKRVRENKRVRRKLPQGGRIHIDRQLPFLCIYRRPGLESSGIDAGAERLLTSEASYIVASSSPEMHRSLQNLVSSITRILAEQFGSCLILEIWTSAHQKISEYKTDTGSSPEFCIHIPASKDPGKIVDVLASGLGKIRVDDQCAIISETQAPHWWPPSYKAIFSDEDLANTQCYAIGLEVVPIFRDQVTGSVFPVVLRNFERALTKVLRRTFFEFSREHTKHRPKHFHMLGRRAMVKAVWEVDKHLAQVGNSYDFLLQVTPLNAGKSWQEFHRCKFEKSPIFHYRPLPIDPAILKRKIFNTPVERVEDPTLSHLFRQKQDELDRQLTMLNDISTPRFVHGSLQLFGDIKPDLLELSKNILEKTTPKIEQPEVHRLDAKGLASLARRELKHYKDVWPDTKIDVQIRDDITAGLMVSQGSLLIGKDLDIPASRADALIQHEVGTHLLTYNNGRDQPFQQLYLGMAGYDDLQEGLAVFAEYLVGGLTEARVRILAARFIAASQMIDGASFVETFRTLHTTYGFSKRVAFNIALRIFRGGGFTKDIVYLRGLHQVLEYFNKGGEMEPLFTGKIAISHLAIIRELRWRKILKKPPVLPLYLQRPEVKKRLELLQSRFSILDLFEGNMS